AGRAGRAGGVPGRGARAREEVAVARRGAGSAPALPLLGDAQGSTVGRRVLPRRRSRRRAPRPAPGPSRAQAAVFDAVRPLGLGAEAAAAVGFVVLVVALEPDDAALALEGEDVGGDAVEEPAVVADDDRAAREVDERVLERAQRVDVEVVGR